MNNTTFDALRTEDEKVYEYEKREDAWYYRRRKADANWKSIAKPTATERDVRQLIFKKHGPRY